MSFNTYWQAEQQRRALREAMQAVRNREEGAVTRLQSALRNVIVLLPVREVPPNHEIGDTIQGANVPLQVMLSRDEQGKQHLVVFTSEQELAATYPAAPPFVGMSFAMLAQLATQAPIVDVVIDRNGAAPVTVPPSLLNEWARPAGGAVAPDAPAPARVAGQAQLTPPPRMVTWNELQALEEILREQEGLVQAYLFGVLQGTPPPLLTVGLGFTVQPTPEILQNLARRIGKLLGASGVLALDSRLPLLLSRQPGTIRFDLEVPSPPLQGHQGAAQAPTSVEGHQEESQLPTIGEGSQGEAPLLPDADQAQARNSVQGQPVAKQNQEEEEAPPSDGSPPAPFLPE